MNSLQYKISADVLIKKFKNEPGKDNVGPLEAISLAAEYYKIVIREYYGPDNYECLLISPQFPGESKQFEENFNSIKIN